MRSAARKVLATCAALAVASQLMGWLRAAKTTIEGPPPRPVFVFDTAIVLADFTVQRWTGERWAKLWGIENAPSIRERVRQVEYGVVPKGYEAYVPLKEPTLSTNGLYQVDFEGGPVRGGLIFAVVERDGKPTIVELDAGKPETEIVAEFERLAKPPSR